MVEQKLYSFPKDLIASIKNARITIRDVSNLLMGQEVLQEQAKVLEEDEGLANVERCVKLYPKVIAKVSQNSDLKRRLV